VIASHLREVDFRLGQCWTYTAAFGTPNSTANAPNSRMIVIRLISMLRKVQQPCLGRTSSTGDIVTPNQDLETLPKRSVPEEAVFRAESKQAVIEAVYEEVRRPRHASGSLDRVSGWLVEQRPDSLRSVEAQ
jgi:hypothetical protein